MKIKSEVLYLIEAKAFFLYCKTVGHPRVERTAWWLYSKIFTWSIPRAQDLDNYHSLACACSICREQRKACIKVGGF
jgi:hypothetical protein